MGYREVCTYVYMYLHVYLCMNMYKYEDVKMSTLPEKSYCEINK
jgi:hypothetical protein